MRSADGAAIARRRLRGGTCALALALIASCASGPRPVLVQQGAVPPGSTLSVRRESAGLSWSLRADESGLVIVVGATRAEFPGWNTTHGLAFTVAHSSPPKYVFRVEDRPPVAWQGRELVVGEVHYDLTAPGTWRFGDDGLGLFGPGPAAPAPATPGPVPPGG